MGNEDVLLTKTAGITSKALVQLTVTLCSWPAEPFIRVERTRQRA